MYEMLPNKKLLKTGDGKNKALSTLCPLLHSQALELS